MKGMGPKEERETVINFNEANEMASVWTASEPVYRKLLKLGWKLEEDNERHAVFGVPKSRIRLPHPVSAARQAQGQALARAKRG